MTLDTLGPWQLASGILALAWLATSIGWIWYRARVNRAQQTSAQNETLQATRWQAKLQEQQNLAQRYEQESAHKSEQIQKMFERITQLQSEQAGLVARRNAEQKKYEEQLALVRSEEKRLTESFQNLANSIFEEKRQAFKKDNQESIEHLLSPLRNQMQDFRKRVEDVYEKDTDDRRQLRSELNMLRDLNSQMSVDAQNLTKALKGDNKTQGNWGEMVLEKVLQSSGLRKGHEYDVQVALKDESGARLIPDVIVHLPEKKDIIIDSKVSLVDYERAVASEDESDREVHLTAHVQSIKKHIQQLAGKKYESLANLRTLDFVLLFVPVEAAFMKAIETDPSIFNTAFEKNIILVSPTTLLATLRTVQSIWRYEHQNRNAEKIAQDAGRLYDQFALVLESLQEIGYFLNKTQKSYDQAVKRIQTGRGNLLGRAEKLREMGAKTKKTLPKQFENGMLEFEE